MSTPFKQASVVRCPTCDGSGVVPKHKQDEFDRLRAARDHLIFENHDLAHKVAELDAEVRKAKGQP